jgi:hypothetical protein
MQRLLTCPVCGAQFLRSSGPGTTCSTACAGKWRFENKGRDKVRSQAAPADALSPEAKRSASSLRKSVLTPDGHFPNVTSAARHHKISEDTVRLRIRAEWPGWRYAEPYRVNAPRGREELS